jgi:hypothetical protein
MGHGAAVIRVEGYLLARRDGKVFGKKVKSVIVTLIDMDGLLVPPQADRMSARLVASVVTDSVLRIFANLP